MAITSPAPRGSAALLWLPRPTQWRRRHFNGLHIMRRSPWQQTPYFRGGSPRCKCNALAICRLDTGATVAAEELTYPLPFHHTGLGFFLCNCRANLSAEQRRQKSNHGDLLPVIKAHPGRRTQGRPDQRVRKREGGEWGWGRGSVWGGRGGGARERGCAQTTSRLGESYLLYIWNTPLFLPFNSHEIVQEEVIAERGDTEEVMWNG